MIAHGTPCGVDADCRCPLCAPLAARMYQKEDKMTPQEDQHAEDLVDVMCELAKQPSTRENAQLMAELTDPLTKEQLEIVLFGALGYIGAVYDQLGALMPTANTRGRL